MLKILVFVCLSLAVFTAYYIYCVRIRHEGTVLNPESSNEVYIYERDPKSGELRQHPDAHAELQETR